MKRQMKKWRRKKKCCWMTDKQEVLVVVAAVVATMTAIEQRQCLQQLERQMPVTPRHRYPTETESESRCWPTASLDYSCCCCSPAVDQQRLKVQRSPEFARPWSCAALELADGHWGGSTAAAVAVVAALSSAAAAESCTLRRESGPFEGRTGARSGQRCSECHLGSFCCGLKVKKRDRERDSSD